MFQLGAALLDACVLAVLARGDTYGYKLTQDVKEVITVSESTLYPVLRRLQKDSLLGAYDSPYNGRNRRYYQITQTGNARLGVLRSAWDDFAEKVGHILAVPAPDASGSKTTTSKTTGKTITEKKGGAS